MATRAGQGGARHGAALHGACAAAPRAPGPHPPRVPPALPPAALALRPRLCPQAPCTGPRWPGTEGSAHAVTRVRGHLRRRESLPGKRGPPVFFNMTFQGCLEKGRTETVGRYGSLTHKPRLHPAGAAQSLGPHPCPLPLNSHALPHGRASCPGPQAPSPQLSRVQGRGRREVHGSSGTPISFLALTFKSSVLNDLLEKFFI